MLGFLFFFFFFFLFVFSMIQNSGSRKELTPLLTPSHLDKLRGGYRILMDFLFYSNFFQGSGLFLLVLNTFLAEFLLF